MKKFKELENVNVKQSEDNINLYWDSINILESTIKNREGQESFVFFEGPPTANNLPGIHHVISRDLKDSICKYKTMKGFKVLRKAGWDTHGLPVELEVEKELGFNSKNDIEKYGIKEFNEKCRASVWKYKSEWEKMTREMGYFIDLNNPYITCDNNYIESVWWMLKKYFDEGLIYEGHKILPYCARCGTGLASHEVAQGYMDIQVDTVVVPMKLKNENNTYFLVWTTTPWTLISNVAICVNPNYEYVKVKSGENYFILAKDLLDKVLGEDYEIIETYKGTDLENIAYEQLLPFLSVDKKAFYVTCDEYVTAEDGTGIVHIAPAFGADDYNIGRRYDLPFLNPVGEDGKYTEGPWKGIFVIDADKEIIKYLKENDKLFKKERINHNYPHCWRCKTPLLYYSKPSWYIEVTRYKEKLIENNNGVNWYPDYVGEKRFGNWLDNLNDWAISRTRYWGTPLPIWKCECGHMEAIGSRSELVEKAIEKVDETIELHRPYVDDVHIKCVKCDGEMTRVKDVIDCWFDSGSMPFAQYHYQFENKELFNSQFPADFICEGIDQTRGWFYSLLAISSFVKGVSPYKNVLVNDHIQDKLGRKMSKSLGNGVNPFKLFETYGADAARWYLLYVSPVWLPTRFDEDGLKEVQSKFFNTLKNTYTFFAMYANMDEMDPREFNVPYENLEEIDKWLLSKYNNLIKNVTDNFEKFDLNKVVHIIQDFVCDDLSNWYIRRNRRRFWGSILDDSKRGVYQTTYEVLLGLSKLIAPIVPFFSETLYRNLTDNKSVHLSDYPLCDENLIDMKIEERMDLVIELISIGRSIREDAKLKVRQPLSEVLIESKYEVIIKDLDVLIKEELNVKNVTYVSNIGDYLKVSYKPNFKNAGRIFGNDIKAFTDYLNHISNEDMTMLEKNNLTVKLGDNEYVIDNELVIKTVSSIDNYAPSMSNYKIVVLNTKLDDELINEGNTRELVSKVQQLRKAKNFDVSDHIRMYLSCNYEFKNSINGFSDYIKTETLAEVIDYEDDIIEKIDINEYQVGIRLEKI